MIKHVMNRGRLDENLSEEQLGPQVPFPPFCRQRLYNFLPSEYEVFLLGEIVPEKHLTQEHQAQQWAR